MSELPPLTKDDYRPPSDMDKPFHVELVPRISESRALAEKSYESFKALLGHMSKVSKLTELELIEEVESKIRFPLSSYEHTLMNELVRRYEKTANIKRSEDEWPEPTADDLAEIERVEAEIEANKDKVLYWVVRLPDGTFDWHDGWHNPGFQVELSKASHYPTQEAAEQVAKNIVGSTVVGVVP